MSSKSPEIRFNGFTDDWEQRKWNTVMKVNSGRDYKHLDPGEIPVYGTGGYMLSVNSALSNKDSIGIGRKGTIDKPQYLTAPFWTVDTLFYMTPLKNHNLKFLYFLSQKINWKKLDESTGVPSLSKVNIEKINQSFPIIEEQQKIGYFFDHLEKTIALHQRELENFKKARKLFLLKMFPKKGEIVSEIRFHSFGDDWKRVSIGSISNLYQPQTISQSELTESGYPVFGANGYIGHFSKSNHLEDQVTISARGENTGNPNYVEGPSWITGNSMVVNVEENTNINKLFLFNLLKRNSLKKYVTGGAQPQLTRTVLEKVKLKITSIQEQKNIGDFFKQLDEMISLHEKYIELLKKAKKAFLQKMFV